MKKLWIIIAGLFIVLIVFIGLLSYHKHTLTQNNQANTVPVHEKGGSGGLQTLNIEGTSSLYSHLLAQQFVAVKQAIGRYIQSSISPNVNEATITPNSTVLNYNGSINFTVQTSNPTKTFQVLLQMPNAQEIIFNVVGTSYQDALYPYVIGGNTE